MLIEIAKNALEMWNSLSDEAKTEFGGSATTTKSPTYFDHNFKGFLSGTKKALVEWERNSAW